MSAFPDGLTGPAHQDLEGRAIEVLARRVVLGLLVVFLIAGLFSLFGQRSATVTASGGGATLTVRSPDALRGGLVYQTKITAQGAAAIDAPKLVLSPGFLDGLTINTLEPSPAEEKTVDGHLVLTFPPVEAGDLLTVWIDGQVNPTTVGRRVHEVTLRDGENPLVSARLDVEVYP